MGNRKERFRLLILLEVNVPLMFKNKINKQNLMEQKSINLS